MREKIKVLTYECKKCNKSVYFFSNEEYSTQCKTCKSELIFRCEHNYNPQNGLKAIKGSNINNKSNTEFFDNQKPQIECPYCHSTNTKKISGMSKAGAVVLFGIFAIGKTSKQWHCNGCGSDF